MSTPRKNAKAARKQLTPEQEKKVAYSKMVAAVRDWLAVEHPNSSGLGPNRIDICLYEDNGGGETLACFHATADDPYLIGSLRAIEEQG